MKTLNLENVTRAITLEKRYKSNNFGMFCSNKDHIQFQLKANYL